TPAPSDPAEAIQLQRSVGPASRRSMRRWLAAAAVLLAIGAAVPAAWYGRDYRNTKGIIANAESRIKESANARSEAEQQLAHLPQEKQNRSETIHKAQRDSQLQVEVQGPASVRVGAPTDYQISTRNLNGEPTEAKVSVDVRDPEKTIATSLAVANVAPGV